MSSGVHGVSRFSSTPPATDAVSISADLISDGVQPGWIARTSAPAPATCGEAIEVPLSET
jgi:hypothetical protein